MASENTEQLRLVALQDYDVGSMHDDGALEALLKLASQLSGVRSAAVNIIASRMQHTIAAVNPHYPAQLERRDSLCTVVVDDGRMMEVPDAAVDPRFCNNPVVTAAGGLRYYAGFPLVSGQGAILGALCLTDSVPHQLTAQQKAHVADLASIAGSLLEAHRAELRRRRIAAILQVQSQVLQQAALGQPLEQVAENLLLGAAEYMPGVRSSLMTVAEDGEHLRWLAGPALPSALVALCAVQAINADSLPCGVAAHTRQEVFSENLGADAAWRHIAPLMAEFGIVGLWSVPLFATGGTLVGAFALYFDAIARPGEAERELGETIGGTASILIERDRSLRHLIESERRLKEAQQIAGLGAYDITAASGLCTGTAITARILGLPAETTTLSIAAFNDMLHPEDLLHVLNERAKAGRTGEPIEISYRITRRNDGAVRWIKGRGVTIYDENGDAVRQTGVLQDITAQREAEQALRLNQRAVESASNGVLIVDALASDMPIIYVNQSFETLTGYSQAEILGRNCRFLQGEESHQPGLRHVMQAIQDQRDGHALLRNYRKDGSSFWVDLRISPVRDEQGQVTHYVGFQTDCTDRIRYQDELRHQAGHDSLTGLANRSLLQDRIDQALLRRKPGEQLAVVFIDLDRFKLINDSLGHAAGDLLLKQCSLRINASVEAQDTVARMGGDEFVVLLHQVAGPQAVQQQIDAILLALNEPFSIDGNTISISASAGIALYPAHGETTVALLRNADIAMYDAKSHGRDNSRVFSAELSERAANSLRLKAELMVALAEKQFCLHYQPKIDARSGALAGFEALVRWNHPVRGLLYPGSFIDAAEEFGLISELGSWVLREACRQTRAWHLAGSHTVTVAVNVSAAQFRNQAFLAEVEQILAETELAACFLELEITETLVMESPQQFIQILSHLHRAGVTISVDDFGTGYSSLSFVKQFPIDYLKIDKSFVNDISTDPSDAAICDTIITMGHNLGLLVIAEGVETLEQAVFLREHGCDILQGYLISRPQPPESDFGIFPRQLHEPR